MLRDWQVYPGFLTPLVDGFSWENNMLMLWLLLLLGWWSSSNIEEGCGQKPQIHTHTYGEMWSVWGEIELVYFIMSKVKEKSRGCDTVHQGHLQQSLRSSVPGLAKKPRQRNCISHTYKFHVFNYMHSTKRDREKTRVQMIWHHLLCVCIRVSVIAELWLLFYEIFMAKVSSCFSMCVFLHLVLSWRKKKLV